MRVIGWCSPKCFIYVGVNDLGWGKKIPIKLNFLEK